MSPFTEFTDSKPLTPRTRTAEEEPQAEEAGKGGGVAGGAEDHQPAQQRRPRETDIAVDFPHFFLTSSLSVYSSSNLIAIARDLSYETMIRFLRTKLEIFFDLSSTFVALYFSNACRLQQLCVPAEIDAPRSFSAAAWDGRLARAVFDEVRQRCVRPVERRGVQLGAISEARTTAEAQSLACPRGLASEVDFSAAAPGTRSPASSENVESRKVLRFELLRSRLLAGSATLDWRRVGAKPRRKAEVTAPSKCPERRGSGATCRRPCRACARTRSFSFPTLALRDTTPLTHPLIHCRRVKLRL